MSYPSLLGPWYVVQRINHSGLDEPLYMEYYTSVADGPSFQQRKRLAVLFMSLSTARAVAAAEGAEIRVLTTKEDAEEFDRG